MKNSVFLLLCLLAYSAHSQNIEVSGGYVNNTYYSSNKSSYASSNREPGNGFSIGFGFDSVMLEIIPLKFNFFITQYDGYAYESEIANAGGHTIEFYGKNTALMIQFHFVNLRFKRIGFSVGINGSFLIESKHSGFMKTWMITGNNHYYDLNNDSLKNETKFIFGVSGSIRYYFPLNSRIEIAPQYRFYFGMLPEFSGVMNYIGAMQHIFEISAVYHLN